MLQATSSLYGKRMWFWKPGQRRIVTSIEFKKKRIDLQVEKALTWYACGPTVYDDAHIGHARTYVATDIIRRILHNHFRVPVEFAMGITDIDDKIIARGKALNFKHVNEFKHFTERMEREFLEDMDSLNVQRPDALLRVTEHIPDIIRFIKTLIDDDHAYATNDGVYFAVDKLPDDHEYDRFSRLNEDYESNRETSTTRTFEKRDRRDFALWKCCGEEEPGWPSPWGRGRPGWHIECSTMTYEFFGTSLDIHSGGIDLQYPHHTNEIAQSECHHRAITKSTCQQTWVSNWIHTGHIHIAGQKMSKSLKNFITIRQYLQAGLSTHPADDFRMYCLQHKYSTHMTYADERIYDAAITREKFTQLFHLVETTRNLQTKMDAAQRTNSFKSTARPTKDSKGLLELLHSVEKMVDSLLARNFNTPAVLNRLLDLVSASNVYGHQLIQQLSSPTCEDLSVAPLEPLLAVERYVRRILSMLGLRFADPNVSSPSPSSTSDAEQQQKFNDLLQIAVDLRSAARHASVDHLKAMSKIEKAVNCNSIDIRTAFMQQQEDTKGLCRSILSATDTMRASVQSQLGIKIDDVNSSNVVIRSK